MPPWMGARAPAGVAEEEGGEAPTPTEEATDRRASATSRTAAKAPPRGKAPPKARRLRLAWSVSYAGETTMPGTAPRTRLERAEAGAGAEEAVAATKSAR